MTMHVQHPPRSTSPMHRIRHALHERMVRVYGALESLGLTCIAMHQLLLRREGPNKLSNLERWLVRNEAGSLWKPSVIVDVSEALTGHLPLRSADGWRCLLCASWSERPLGGRCDAPLMVSATDVWRRVRQERCRLRTRCGG